MLSPSTPASPSTDHRRGGRSIVAGWLVTRVLMIVLLLAAERVALGDPTYYWRKIGAMFDVGLAQTLNEYPTPVTWMLWVPYALGGGTRLGYRIAFIVLMMALDAVFCWLLWRLNTRRRDAAVDFWLAFLFLIGPLSYLRFDLVPAVLAGAALLLVARRPAVAGVLTGIGAAIKLWPALLIGLVAAERRVRRRALLGFLVSGIGLAVLSLVFGGWSRLVSPLTWQSDRGLQIESPWATPLMVLRALRPDVWRVDISRYQAYEIFGPGVQGFLVASTVATVLGLLVIAGLIARAFRHGNPTPVAVGLGMLAVIAIMTITNKTLSPQYLLWLGGPMAGLLLMDRRVRHERRALVRRLAIQLLVLAALTQLVYPLLYSGLQGLHGNGLTLVATVVLTLRNLALLVFTVAVCASAWRALRPAPTPVVPLAPPI
ncbi:hypothetical protein FHX74_003210 [Friedmanniella endophytica]|uniref:DUF2029 domain-containing protein n=1 Tax=Microlunatus kandeliicorticis TaxID=1759536 RepID=A0A7W3IUM4_9ACTN|nr:glycosyltransferase 87 family protein [Microlunatus kandeliicorticis]MBA8795574.1 hypothetical protein [Microlunatus kandeliicorticis]